MPNLQLPATPAESASRTATGERAFGLHEMFFSLTDEKGLIRTGNDVFARVSGYPKEEMIGKPHNLVRHPDMPRVVFKLLWDEITAGRPIAAYVKNRAADGAYYWVMATVLPAAGGYLSVRIKPTSALFDTARSLYTRLREVERAVEGPDGLKRKQGMDASGELLQSALLDAGYDSYDAFMREALLAEVRAREVGRREGAAPKHVQPGDGRYAEALAYLQKADQFLAQLVLRLDDYIGLNVRLGEKTAFVRDLAEDVRLFALNAIVIASKASGRDGAAIGAVAALLQRNADSGSLLFGELGDAIAAAAGPLGRMLFPVAAARIQSEMLLTFMTELSQSVSSYAQADLDALYGCLKEEVRALVQLLTEFDGRLRAMEGHVQQLRGVLKTMRALSLNGRIEAARMGNAGQFTTLFTTVDTRVNTAWDELDALSKASAAFTRHGEALGIEAAVEAALGRQPQPRHQAPLPAARQGALPTRAA